MEEGMLRTITAYLLHDAVGNVEGYINDYDKEALAEAEEKGMLILAEYSDGSREIVHAADVEKPEPVMNGVVLVKPEYVDERTEAVIAVFDALATEYLAPQASVMSLDGEAEPPEPGFFAALAKLKELAYGDVER